MALPDSRAMSVNLSGLDAAAFWRTAAVMRHRGHVTDRGDVEPGSGQGAQRRFTTRTGTLNFDLKRLHAMFLRFFASIFCCKLRGVGCRFPRALEAHRASGRPGYGVALHVGDQDLGVVEAGVHMRDASSDVLGDLFLASTTGITCHWCRPPLLLLTGNGLCGAFAGTCVGVGPLAADREVATMAQATVAAQIHQTLV